MGSRSYGATTHPETVTGSGAFGAGKVGILWVFPERRLVPLSPGSTLGRDADCGMVLPGHDVSRRHAEVRAGPLPHLYDLGSRNGTWINGVRVDDRLIGPSDVVRLGEWVGIACELGADERFGSFGPIGEGWLGGASLAHAIEPARRVAGTDLPIILEGETGTGKEGAARFIHAVSGRRGPFVAVNCAALPQAMAEAELFGYRKGAFTGAERASEGFFRAAQGGTLFLDEILELPAANQPKLLRVLEQREVQPLGEPRAVAIDVRVVCATQEPLSMAVAEKRFRPDLFARLDGVTIRLPPLRERREDIAPLFSHVLHEVTPTSPNQRPPALDPKLVETLLLYDWPLNVRELVLLARRMLALYAGEPTWKRAMLPDRMTGIATAVATDAVASVPRRASTTDEAAFERLLSALRKERGNVSRAAASVGISRARAYRLLEARRDVDVRSLRAEDE